MGSFVVILGGMFGTPWSVLVARGVTVIAWWGVRRLAPVYLGLTGWPVSFQSVAVTLGLSLALLVPVAAPQGLEAYERVKQEIRREVEATLEAERRLRDEQHAGFSRELERQGKLIDNISAKVEPIPVLSSTVAGMDTTLYWVAVSVITWVVTAFLSLLVWVFRYFVLRRNGGHK